MIQEFRHRAPRVPCALGAWGHPLFISLSLSLTTIVTIIVIISVHDNFCLEAYDPEAMSLCIVGKATGAVPHLEVPWILMAP